MGVYVAFAAVFAAYVIFEYFATQPRGEIGRRMRRAELSHTFFVMLAIGLVLRLCLAYFTTGYETDLNCFRSWSERIRDLGFGNFYDQAEQYFADYPPGYYYVLYLLGWVAKLVPGGFSGPIGILLLKLPAIVFDALIAVVLFRYALRRENGRAAALLPALIILNPALIADSAVWGQIDSIFTFLILMCIISLCERRYWRGTLWYAFALLLKPQALLFAPIIFCTLLFAREPVYLPRISARPKRPWSIAVYNLLLCMTGGFALLWLGCLPFSNVGFLHIIREKYFSTMGFYDYASVNASNLYALLGGNFEQSVFFEVLSAIFLILIFVLIFLIFWRFRHADKPVFAAFFSSLMMYLFLTKMHERYLYPAIVLGCLWLIVSRERRAYWWTAALSAIQFLLIGRVLDYLSVSSKIPNDAWLLLPSAGLLLLGIVVAVYAWQHVLGREIAPDTGFEPGGEAAAHSASRQARQRERIFRLRLPEVTPKLSLKRADVLLLAAILVGYGALSFVALGDRVVPETYYLAETEGEHFTVDLGHDVDIERIDYYSGLYLGRYGIRVEAEDGTLHELETQQNSVFCLHSVGVEMTGRYVTVTAYDAPLMLAEMAIYEEGATVPVPVQSVSSPLAEDDTLRNLFDEQELLPTALNYTNSMYFDEIYHGRTGFEFLHGFAPYETTHPPLGKVLIAGSIALWGMNPFGWRFAGVLFGILAVAVIYLFAKRVFGKTAIACGAALLFALDFMHFTQSRIGTVDAFTVVLVLLSFYFMYVFYASCVLQKRLRAMLWPLFFSGLFFGLAGATKWNCLYAGLGLLAVYVLALVRLLRGCDRRTVFRYLAAILTTSVCGFVLMPVGVYLLSYLPYWRAAGTGGFLETVLKSQQNMLHYHAQLTSTHPYQSAWYEWLVDKRPLWYSYNELPDGTFSSIAAFGNPLIWWTGLPALAVCLYTAVRRRSDIAMILLFAYASQLLPWMFVSRVTFIYHYYNLTPFLILMIVYCIYALHPKRRWPTYAYYAACGLLFAMFYPVISGVAVEKSYLQFLTWLPSWTFYIR